MALIIENGSIVPGAESYVSVADCETYCTNRGLAFTGTVDLQEQALRRATVWLDGAFRARYVGWRKEGRSQPLEWPRKVAQVQTQPNDFIADDVVPQEVIDANCEAAVRELATPGGLSPDITPGKIQTKVAVSGAVSVEYAATANATQDQRPVMTVISSILSPVLKAAQLFTGGAYRG